MTIFNQDLSILENYDNNLKKIFLYGIIVIIILLIGNRRVKSCSERKKELVPITIAISVFITGSLLFSIIMRGIMFDTFTIGSENTAKAREIHRDKQYESHTAKEDCHLCGENTDQLLSLYWGEKNVGIINLNTFEFSRIEINRYDDYKNLIEKKITATLRSNKHFQSGESVSLQIESDRGFATGEINLSENVKLSLESLESFLCSECLTKLMNKYFYNEDHWDVGLINFADKTIKPLDKHIIGFSSGDYYIWSDYEEEYNRIKLKIFYCPVRYK